MANIDLKYHLIIITVSVKKLEFVEDETRLLFNVSLGDAFLPKEHFLLKERFLLSELIDGFYFKNHDLVFVIDEKTTIPFSVEINDLEHYINGRGTTLHFDISKETYETMKDMLIGLKKEKEKQEEKKE